MLTRPEIEETIGIRLHFSAPGVEPGVDCVLAAKQSSKEKKPIVAAQQSSGGQTLADRYAKNVDFTKPVSTATSASSGGGSQCTLSQAKDKILAERAALASVSATAAPVGNNPCSLDDAKAKIVEARRVLQELDQSGAGVPAAAPQAKVTAKPAAAAKKAH